MLEHTSQASALAYVSPAATKQVDPSSSESVAWPPLTCTEGCGPVAPAGDALSCARGHRWPLRSGIPRFVPASSYADAFGLQWNTFRRTQLDSHTGVPLSRDRARRCIGEDGWAMLDRAAPPAQVLEVGCGAGRFTEVLLSTRAAVTSVDLSSAVEANQANCPQGPRHRIVQADVARLPFAARQFDLVLCLGVIQHTPNPERTIAQLYEQVRPGGLLVIDHYPFSVLAYLKSAPLFRAVFTRLPPATGLRWTKRVVDFFLPLHERFADRRVPRSLLARISPVVAYYSVLPLRIEDQREWALLDTHDALTDRYKHRRTPGQIRRTLERLGAEQIWCERGGNGVEARARRPM